MENSVDIRCENLAINQSQSEIPVFSQTWCVSEEAEAVPMTSGNAQFYSAIEHVERVYLPEGLGTFDGSKEINSDTEREWTDEPSIKTEKLEDNLAWQIGESSPPSLMVDSCTTANDDYVLEDAKQPFGEEVHEYEHRCTVCAKLFSASHKLKRHMKCHGEKPYSCAFCSKQFTVNSNLQRHMHVHNPIKPFKCEECPKSFGRMYYLKKHMRTHNKHENYQCGLCGKHYKGLDYLKGHMLEHQGVKEFSCGVCWKKFPSVRRLTGHMICHMEKKYKCRMCRKGFQTKIYMKAHEITHCTANKSHCEICKRSVRNIETHMRVHTNNAPFRCELCGKGFCTKRALKVHLDSIFHTGMKDWMCQVCGQTLATKDSLRKHELRVHSTEKLFNCKICSKAFSATKFLNEHMRTHLPKMKIYVCGQCNREYSSKRCLEDHVALHSSGRSFTCQLCNKMCFTQAQLDKHVTNHLRMKMLKKAVKVDLGDSPAEELKPVHTTTLSKNKVYCTICEKSCKTNSELSIHMRSRHPGQKPFKCSQCDQAFLVEEFLRVHINMKH